MYKRYKNKYALLNVNTSLDWLHSCLKVHMLRLFNIKIAYIEIKSSDVTLDFREDGNGV